jgi:hypothetical protein
MTARIFAVLGLAALFGGAAAVVLGTLGRGGTSSDKPPPATTTARAPARPPPPPVRPPAPKPRRPAVRVAGVAAFDPEGDRAENDDLAPEATDGDLSTFWRTENYRSFFKKGVGLVLDARRPVRLSSVVLRTDTPGFSADIRVGAAPDGPFEIAAPPRRVSTRTVFALRRTPPARYVLVWVTGMPDNFAAHVNEVTATGR